MAATLTDSVIAPARTRSTAWPKGNQLRVTRSSGSCASGPAARPVARNMCEVSVVTPLLLSMKPSSRQVLADNPVSSRSSRWAAASMSWSAGSEPPVGSSTDIRPSGYRHWVTRATWSASLRATMPTEGRISTTA